MISFFGQAILRTTTTGIYKKPFKKGLETWAYFFSKIKIILKTLNLANKRFFIYFSFPLKTLCLDFDQIFFKKLVNYYKKI